MARLKVLYGFHAVTARMRHDASTVEEVYYDATRKDRRMTEFLHAAKEAGVRLIAADETRLWGLAHTERHQGVVARASDMPLAQNLAELLDGINGSPLILVLDGVTDPHNLGACLRVADAAGAHAVIAPRDRAVGLNATAAKVASGAADTVPYITVTNLARALRELKDAGRVGGRHGWRGDQEPLRHGAGRSGGAGDGRGRRGHAPPHARHLRRGHADSDGGDGRKPERVGRERRVPVRSGPAALGEEVIRRRSRSTPVN